MEQATEANLTQNPKRPPTSWQHAIALALVERRVCQMLALGEQGMGDKSDVYLLVAS